MKNSTYINVEFIVYEFVSMEHGTKIVIASEAYTIRFVVHPVI